MESIAKEFGARVYPHKLEDYVEPVRNFGIQKAKGNWILIIDPDEEISPGLDRNLRKAAQSPKADYYRIPRKNIIFGKWMKYSRWWPDYNVRFFRKGYVSWNEVIHAVPVTKGKGLDIPAEERFAIIHHHYDTVEQFVERMNRYTSVQAGLKVKEGYKFDYLDLIKKPIAEFLSRFFAGEGYKDGVHGLALSLLQTFSEFVVYLKLWQKSGFKDEKVELIAVRNEVKKIRREMNYWFSDALFKERKNILEIVKRKFKLL